MGKRVTEILAVVLLLAAVGLLGVFLIGKFVSAGDSGDGGGEVATAGEKPDGETKKPDEKKPEPKKPDEKKPEPKKPEPKKPEPETPDVKKPDVKALATYNLTFSGRSLKIEQLAAGKWRMGSGTTLRQVEIGTDNKVKLTSGGKAVAAGKIKGEKLKLAAAGGGFYLEMKFTAEKIKITTESGKTPWELKVKPDKIKVARGEKTLGKVKYYKEGGKLKVKDAKDAVVAESRNLGRLRAAPGVVLIPDLKGEKLELTMLLLFARGR